MLSEFPEPPDAYVYPWLGGDTGLRTEAAIELVLPYSVATLWIDAEDNGHGATGVPDPSAFPAGYVVEKIDVCFRACDAAGQATGYYGAPWWHNPSTLEYTGWSDRLLWVAQYDGIEDLAVFTSFGGWERCQAKQYRNTHTEAGVSIDSNVMLVEQMRQ